MEDGIMKHMYYIYEGLIWIFIFGYKAHSLSISSHLFSFIGLNDGKK